MNERVITISARVIVGLSVDAFRDEDGVVQILSVRSIVGLPEPSDIFESFDDSDFDELDRIFSESEIAP